MRKKEVSTTAVCCSAIRGSAVGIEDRVYQIERVVILVISSVELIDSKLAVVIVRGIANSYFSLCSKLHSLMLLFQQSLVVTTSELIQIITSYGAIEKVFSVTPLRSQCIIPN